MKLGNVELVDNCARRKLDTMHVPLKFENSEQITLSVMMFTLVIFCTLGTLWDPSCVWSLSVDGMFWIDMDVHLVQQHSSNMFCWYFIL